MLLFLSLGDSFFAPPESALLFVSSSCCFSQRARARERALAGSFLFFCQRRRRLDENDHRSKKKKKNPFHDSSSTSPAPVLLGRHGGAREAPVPVAGFESDDRYVKRRGRNDGKDCSLASEESSPLTAEHSIAFSSPFFSRRPRFSPSLVFRVVSHVIFHPLAL